MGNKIKAIKRAATINEQSNWIVVGYRFWCPGCQENHTVAVYEKQSNGAIWSFNENLERPTFTPSINIRTGKYANPQFIDNEGLSSICHCFVIDGSINYLPDCTHELKGKIVELKDITE